MTLPDVAQIVSVTVAYAGSATKLLGASRFIWDRMPAWAQRVLPGVLIGLGEVPRLFTGVATPTELGVAALGAVALGLPGKHVDSVR